MDVRKLDYGVWWSDEDQSFLARPLTLQASTGYGDTPQAALTDANAFARLNAAAEHRPVAQPLSNPGSSSWQPDAIRELRRSLALTQAELAELMNVSVPAVTNWEQKINVPDGASHRLLDPIAANPGFVFRWLLKRKEMAPSHA